MGPQTSARWTSASPIWHNDDPVKDWPEDMTDQDTGEGDGGARIAALRQGTRLQGEWKRGSSFSGEPGEIGLTALKEAGDGIDQDTKGRLAQLATGLTQR